MDTTGKPIEELLCSSDLKRLMLLKRNMQTSQGHQAMCIGTTSNRRNPKIHIGRDRAYPGGKATNIVVKDIEILESLVPFFLPVVSRLFLDVEVKSRSHKGFDYSGLLAHPKISAFKPNDLAVESAEEFVVQKVGFRPGPVVTIFGFGNIGFKLAIKLYEHGFRVNINGLNEAGDSEIFDHLANFMRGSGKFVFFPKQDNSALAGTDAIIGCFPGVPGISAEDIASVERTTLLLDVGNGSFDESAVNETIRRNMPVHVLDVQPGWNGFVRRFQLTSGIIGSSESRQVSPDLCIVNIGVLGKAGDVLVDNVDDPKSVLGVCNGVGDLEYGSDAEAKIQLARRQLGLD